MKAIVISSTKTKFNARFIYGVGSVDFGCSSQIILESNTCEAYSHMNILLLLEIKSFRL